MPTDSGLATGSGVVFDAAWADMASNDPNSSAANGTHFPLMLMILLLLEISGAQPEVLRIVQWFAGHHRPAPCSQDLDT
jgi:hypothetical protein